ncbi:MAG TPA: 50S ribosomal protein L4 [Myxococcota bacterium]|nr:50S ribosomal protein L4 [Myxococcota bacterium]HNZ02610.1 50S ribosomal protein L4 [Myxococcota bacterium]HOD08183.1 50S ribosomal protein L4 [Myxococcota bacterium]
MPTMDVFDLNRKKVGEIELSDEIFGAESRAYLYHAVIRAQLLSKRQGTVKTKKRGEVAGSTRKVFRQKGTGRARKGDSRSPLYRRGGVIFGPQPREWDVKVPKKVKRAALISALSDRVREGGFTVVDSAKLGEIRTKRVAGVMDAFKMNSVLFVDVENRELSLSCRNLPTAKFLSSSGLNLFDVLKYANLVVTKDAVAAIEGALKS